MTATTMLVFARALGLVSRAPGFAHPNVPVIVRAALALGLALAIAPAVHAVAALDLLLSIVAIAGEFALGAAIGTGAALLYDGAYYAGRMVDDYIGVRGSVPSAAVTSAQGFGRLWSSTFLVGFFLLDGWVPVVHAFAGSFGGIAAGSFVTPAAWAHFAFAFPGTFVRATLLVAAPAVVVALALQIGLAAVARIVPRFGSFTLAFPIVIAAALIATAITLPILVPLAAHPWIVMPR